MDLIPKVPYQSSTDLNLNRFLMPLAVLVTFGYLQHIYLCVNRMNKYYTNHSEKYQSFDVVLNFGVRSVDCLQSPSIICLFLSGFEAPAQTVWKGKLFFRLALF